VAERTISPILARHGVPHLAGCDPVTGEPVRAHRATTVRYERDRPGELVHLDVKKIGRIPDGGGRAHGRAATAAQRHKATPIGYDCIHTAIGDHSRLADAEVLPDEKGTTAAAFLTRAATYFTARGIPAIERIITDNALTYRRSTAFRDAVAALGARQKFIRPHCPWHNGKAERLNRTLAPNGPTASPAPPAPNAPRHCPAG
jgi:hypothetical protein